MLLLFDFCIFMVGLMIGVCAHEGGHWLAARLLGFPIDRVRVGVGPILYLGRVGTTAVELRVLPAGGVVIHYPALGAGRIAALLVLMGGVAGNVAVIALIALVASGPSAPLVEAVGPDLMWAQLFLIVSSLIPTRGRDWLSDGYQIVQTLVRGDRRASLATDLYAAMLRPYRSPDAGASPWSPVSSEIYRQHTRLNVLGERAEAAAALLQILDRDKARQDETIFVLDALITKHLLYGGLGLEPHLDALSARALEIRPDLATLRGSRGGCLTELGRYQESRELLAPLAAGAPSFDSILSQLFLARAEHALGQPEAAVRLLETARAANRAQPTREASGLIERIEAEIRPA